MPTYTFRCEECGESQEQRRSVDERDGLALCFECGGEAKRLFTPTSQILVPAAFQLDRDWAGTGGEGTSLGGRSQIHRPRQPSIKEEFDKVKDWL